MKPRAELWCDRVEREAAEKLEALVALPLPEDRDEIGDEDKFDPWRQLFSCLYGSYSEDFDQCAIDVLTEVMNGDKVRSDLGAEMFREMLCTADLCTYGTSPRVCFSHERVAKQLPNLIAKWKAYSLIQWSRK